MPRKSKVQPELIKVDHCSKHTSEPLCTFNSFNMQFTPLKMSSKMDFMESLQTNLTQMSGVQMFSRSSTGSKYQDNIQYGDIKIRNKIIGVDTNDVSFKTNSPYCSQSLKTIKKVNDPESLDIIIPSLAAGSVCFTQAKISECTTTAKSDESKTVSGLDKILDNSRTPSQSDNLFSQYSNNISPNSIIYNPYFKDPLLQERTVVSDTKEGYSTPINQIISNNGIDPFVHHCKKSFQNNSNEDLFSSPQSKRARFSTINEYSTPVNAKRPMKNTMVSANPLSCQNVIYIDEVKKLENELDFYMTELNHNFPDYQTTLSFNNHNDTTNNLTPCKSMKIEEAKKKIVFETVAEVHHNDNSIVDKYEINSLQDRLTPVDMVLTECVETNTFDKVISTVDVMQTPESSISYCSIINDPDINDVHMEDMKCHLSQSQLNDIEVLSINFNENESENSRNHTIENNKSKNDIINECNSQTLSISLPSTPMENEPIELPPSVLLSNFCSEYDRAYTKKDLKPMVYRNYYSDKTDIVMKHYFDHIIPPEKSLTEFFTAPEKSFKKVKKLVSKIVNNIILMLEQHDYSEKVE